jgi:hypothetical protein
MNIQFHNNKMHNKLKEVMWTLDDFNVNLQHAPNYPPWMHGAYAPWKETSQVGFPILHMLSHSCSKLELATH